MKLIVDVSPETEARLRDHAAKQKLSPEQMASKALDAWNMIQGLGEKDPEIQEGAFAAIKALCGSSSNTLSRKTTP